MILVPSTVNYENKLKTFNPNSQMLKFSFGTPCQEQQSKVKLNYVEIAMAAILFDTKHFYKRLRQVLF